MRSPWSALLVVAGYSRLAFSPGIVKSSIRGNRRWCCTPRSKNWHNGELADIRAWIGSMGRSTVISPSSWRNTCTFGSTWKILGKQSHRRSSTVRKKVTMHTPSSSTTNRSSAKDRCKRKLAGGFPDPSFEGRTSGSVCYASLKIDLDIPCLKSVNRANQTWALEQSE